MRALSLWQPWASYMVDGWKKCETRGRLTHVRGRVAIHAAKSKEGLDNVAKLLQLLSNHSEEHGRLPIQLMPLKDALLGYRDAIAAGSLCYGAILAVGKIVGVVATEAFEPEGHEELLGDYSPERFVWLFADVYKLPDPVVCIGRQGFWDLDHDVAARVSEQLHKAGKGL